MGGMNKKIINTLFIFIVAFSVFLLSGCSQENKNSITGNDQKQAGITDESDADWKQMKKTGEMKIDYANQFSVDYYSDGYSLVTIAGSERYLLVPENKTLPSNLENDITPIYLPLKNIYLVSSASMDLFRETDSLDIIKMTGTKAENWSIPEIKKKVEEGSIKFAGKYGSPDYEMILENSCDLAIESTMIFHTPKVKEKLESLGITVLVERSSYETHPLGRTEWIKLYGLLSGKSDLADSFMEKCKDRFDTIIDNVKQREDETEKNNVVIFYITQNGYVNVRKPGDYISKMIELAGGRYAFDDVIPEEENALSVMRIEMETFFEYAKNADYIIYNSSIEGEIDSIEQLIQKSELIGELDAVKNGNVWCTKKDMFQETTGTVNMIEDLYNVIHGNENAKINYLYKLDR